MGRCELETTLSYTVNFIDSLNLSCECKALADVLFKTEEECKAFYIGFLGRNRYVIDDLLDYRENRLAMSDMSLDKFLALCDNRVKQDIFEQVFLQPISMGDAIIIDKAIEQGVTSLSAIYNRFENNVNENILKNVL
jgi:hypothetical protein